MVKDEGLRTEIESVWLKTYLFGIVHSISLTALLQCGDSNFEHNFGFIFSDYRMRVVHPNKSRV